MNYTKYSIGSSSLQLSIILFCTAIGLLLSPAYGFSEDSVRVKTYLQPVLLTSAGQAADVMILRGLALRAGLDIKYRPNATADSLNDVKAVILVAGGSSKGLGAAKIDVKDEESRIKKLVKAAEKAKLPVLVFHIGGEARRGALSDPFNKLAADAGELIIVIKGGDDDGMFKKIAAERKAAYRSVDKQIALVDVLKEIFPKAEAKP
ncbi:MAG: hypothetical protein FJY65_01115 [Calditrichaeota bacterium]|nr:hypothetical protein [Calditrichota bacterium]